MSAPAPILASMKTDGSRLMIHPADVRGRWSRIRRLVFAVLIGFYVLAPFIPVGGHPMIQLDVAHRSFFLFGQTFNSQDFWMVLLLVLSFAFGLLLVTAWRGRVWCGFGCPQSVFIEGVVRPIERFFEGPRERRLKAIDEPWTAGRVARRVAKLGAFLLVSVLVAHTATAMVVSPRELWLMVNEGPRLHQEAFLITSGFTAVLMFNFTWFREQFCIVLCPYGRLQSVLHDKDSITVAYDEARGEPRGKLVKQPVAGAARLGDCIDCKKCIHACPTGIDIRNGLQMECLACNQCVDACDEVMVKVGKPKNLITFASANQFAGGPRRVLRPRVLVYATLMLVFMTSLGIALATRVPFEANVYLPRGMLPYALDGDIVRDSFELHVFNKNPTRTKFHLEVLSPVPASVVIGAPDLELDSLTDQQVPLSVSIDFKHLATPVDLTIVVTDQTSGYAKKVPMRFRAPH